jgi:hypothetical protein
MEPYDKGKGLLGLEPTIVKKGDYRRHGSSILSVKSMDTMNTTNNDLVRSGALSDNFDELFKSHNFDINIANDILNWLNNKTAKNSIQHIITIIQNVLINISIYDKPIEATASDADLDALGKKAINTWRYEFEEKKKIAKELLELINTFHEKKSSLEKHSIIIKLVVGLRKLVSDKLGFRSKEWNKYIAPKNSVPLTKLQNKAPKPLAPPKAFRHGGNVSRPSAEKAKTKQNPPTGTQRKIPDTTKKTAEPLVFKKRSVPAGAKPKPGGTPAKPQQFKILPSSKQPAIAAKEPLIFPSGAGKTNKPHSWIMKGGKWRQSVRPSKVLRP